MNKKHVRRMLRQMASGEPVEVAPAMATMKRLTRLAFIAQQFGYEYADIRQGGGPQGDGYVMLLLPDPTPEARARAERNRALYPNASEGGELPPLVPEAVELLKARITFDITAKYTDRQRILLAGAGAVPLAVFIGFGFGFGLGAGTAAVVITAAAWVAVMALVPVGLAVNRHYRAKYEALLRAAGFTPVTDPDGRLRYVPPGGQLPGHGNPFAVGT